ncbi:hypothetical protein GGH95_003068 [Coemansia sp. RSA 1836]|nr:hypothetical protein GGH95_003068 [Coemansia sp. RSA 1836]
MPTLSTLQILPLHIVQIIVNHVVGSSRVRFDGVSDNSDKSKVLLRPLLWVCHNLRAIAYSRYCNRFIIECDGLIHGMRDQRYMSQAHRAFDFSAYAYLGYPTNRHAKELEIELKEPDIYSGRALRMLSRAPYKGLDFPLVRKVAVVLVSDDMDDLHERRSPSPAKAAANIAAFVERIKQMAPRVDEIRVGPKDLDEAPEVSNRLFGSLVSQLFQLASRIEYAHIDDLTIPSELQLSKINDLASIAYKFESVEGNFGQFIQLTRQNASTLQSIEATSEHHIDVCGLVLSSSGSPVRYPRLLSLKLWGQPGTAISHRPVFKDVVPFPSLQRLSLRIDYPFGDDTMYRGNAAMLESLEIGLDCLTVDVLRKYNVFTPTSHPKLQYVSIGHYGDLVPNPFPTVAECTQFVLSIAPRAAAREMHGASTNASVMPVLSSNGSHACIQVLSLPRTSLTLWDTITLVKSLPLLTDLYTSPPTIGALPAGVTEAKLPAYIRSSYAPMNERFRCWHIKLHMFGGDDDVVLCVLLMALACPNFDYAVLSIGKRPSFMKLVEKAIATDEFRRYAPRLKRLLFNGWNSR